MHDQKKKERQVLTPEAQAAAAQTHERVGALYKSVLASNKAREFTAKTLADTEALLLDVPEAYAAYNCRRLALEAVGTASPSTLGDGSSSSSTGSTAAALSRQEWLVQELKLNSKVLLLNYKNYSAFLHRHWIFNQLEMLATAELRDTVAASGAGCPTDGAASSPTHELLCGLLRKERAQCEQLLQLDERNFHAWNYRRWVLAQESRAAQLVAAAAPAGTSPALFTTDEAAELAYTTQKIKNNFSNYSAWHQRSLALQSAVGRWGSQPRQSPGWRAALVAQLQEDVEFLKQAIYCDPNDQSAWFYAPFVFQLLRGRVGHDGAEAAEAVTLADSFLDSVVDLVAEVDRAGTEDECYLPYYFLLDQLALLQTAACEAPGTRNSASLQRHVAALLAKVPSLAEHATDAAADGGAEATRRRRCFRYLHSRLRKADTLRQHLYDDMLQRALEGCPG
ncbi:Protein prenyltransferase alpha subunit repeat [Novymonas esmeraldas]|uniref:Geranylgeranyl transferase type-2 subunit alpha n=1 Tax=Novymonas esmeraldas TaxID=1808958 RepID=A0AAW0EM74_9TRYP